jgi:hypothetical protein
LKRSSPGKANWFESSIWSSAKILIPNDLDEKKASWTADRVAMQTSTSGGSRLTLENELAVSPWGRPSESQVVAIVMPVANREQARLKRLRSRSLDKAINPILSLTFTYAPVLGL